MMSLYDNHHRSFPSYGYIDGPTVNNNSRPKSKTGSIYDVLGSSFVDSGSASGVGVRFVQQQQQPFDISPTSTSTAHNNIAFKSPGRMLMAASLEFPFTFSQYKELERQVMIFKYMKASIPVPIELLIPITGNPSLAVVGNGGGLNLRFSGRGDVEPGRCRRTDGKKWRCCRDVAPDQKYCERHLHRGRPRSRKPVEPLPNKKTRHSQNQPLPSASFPSAVLTKNASQTPVFGTHPQPFQPSEKPATFWPLNSISRNSDCTMSEELIPLALADQQWDNLMHIETATNYDKEPLNLISCPNFNVSVDEQRNGFPWFDAWSINGAETSVSCNGKPSVSSLSLSMGNNSNMSGDEMGLIRMGLGLGMSEYDNQNHEFDSKSHLSSWLSTPGGPLAEVLRPSANVSSYNLSSSITGNRNSCCPAVTAVSSPSGVLQKALASFSNSNGSSSPTFVSSRVKPEIGLMLG